MSNFSPYDQNQKTTQHSDLLHRIFVDCINNTKNGVDCVKNYENSRSKQLERKENQISNRVDHLLKQLNVDNDEIITNRIQNTFKENSELRDGLELRLQNLYETKNMRLKDANTTMDASTYASLMWTIIATSSLYFIFIYK